MNEQLNETEQTNEDVMADEQAQAPSDDVTPDVNDAINEATEYSVDELKVTIARLQEEVNTNLDGWQRSRAEFNNYRRRTQQQIADSKQQGAMEAFGKMLPIFDDFERAFNNVPEELADNPWVTGTSLILKNIQKVLDEFNIEVVDPVGEEFDPNKHEAIGMDDSDEYESGIVTVTLQKGYQVGDKILRPALVRVAS